MVLTALIRPLSNVPRMLGARFITRDCCRPFAPSIDRAVIYGESLIQNATIGVNLEEELLYDFTVRCRNVLLGTIFANHALLRGERFS